MLFRKKSLRSLRVQKKKKRTLYTRMFLSMFVFLTVISFLAWGARSEQLTIKDISVEGASSLHERILLENIESTLSEKYALLFPKRNTFLYPKRTMTKGLLNEYPEFANISLAIGDLNTLTVAVREREPYGVWCDSHLLQEEIDYEEKAENDSVASTSVIYQLSEASGENREDVQETCYLFDKEGVIFQRLLSLDKQGLFEMHGALQGDSVRINNTSKKPLGFRVLPQSLFEKLEAFKLILLSFDARTRSILFKEYGDFEFIIENGTSVLMNENQDVSKLEENLASFFDVESLSKNILSLPDTQLEYLDMRFGNKVYYRMK